MSVRDKEERDESETNTFYFDVVLKTKRNRLEQSAINNKLHNNTIMTGSGQQQK